VTKKSRFQESSSSGSNSDSNQQSGSGSDRSESEESEEIKRSDSSEDQLKETDEYIKGIEVF